MVSLKVTTAGGNSLANLEEAYRLLAEANRADEAKKIADVAEAMRVYARQAKLGLDAENQAAELKVRAQYRAGELLKEAKSRGELHPGQPAKNGVNSEPFLATARITKRESMEYQELADSPAAVEGYLQTTKEQGGRITSAGARMAVHYSSTSAEWSTPQDLFDALASEFDFDLDVCATAENAKCSTFYTAAEDGLAQPWTGTCWMNPPYGDEIKRWVAKAYESAQAGATVVCLVPARVDTGWWWDYCQLAEIRFLRGRLKFGGGANSAPFPSAVVVFGRTPNSPDGMWWEWH